MRYQKLPSDLYVQNREAFMKAMKPGGLALFFSNDIYPTSADGTLPFKQHADIFYLSGVDQEDTVLLLFPDAHNPADREILFTLETNEELAIWEGAKLTKAQATQETGIANVQWTTAFERTLHRLMAEAQSLYLNDNQHTRAKLTVETRSDRENAALRAKYPHHEIERSAPILHSIRAVKRPHEVDQMQRACDITKAGFERVLRFVKPGVMEYEIEAEFMHEFLRRGSRGFAYTPIIGSGFNACVLHYIENSAECQAGDVILMDVGAEYGNYASDMTRCIPVSGTFTDRQRAVYNAVLSVMQDAMKLLRPGVSLHEYHKEVGDLMTAQLLGPQAHRPPRRREAKPRLARVQEVLHARHVPLHWVGRARRGPLARTHRAGTRVHGGAGDLHPRRKFGHPLGKRHRHHRGWIPRFDGPHSAGSRGHRGGHELLIRLLATC